MSLATKSFLNLKIHRRVRRCSSPSRARPFPFDILGGVELTAEQFKQMNLCFIVLNLSPDLTFLILVFVSSSGSSTGLNEKVRGPRLLRGCFAFSQFSMTHLLNSPYAQLLFVVPSLFAIAASGFRCRTPSSRNALLSE